MNKYKTYGRGWFNESYRHSLAAKGIKSALWSRLRRSMAAKWDVEGMREEGYFIVWMSPDEYLERTGVTYDQVKDDEMYQKYYDVETKRLEPMSKLVKIMKEGTRPIRPLFVSRRGLFASQEGRHRAVAAKLAGEEKIPVAVERPESHVTKEIREEFMKRAFGPFVSPGYVEEWRQRFKTGMPEGYMDKKRLRIYKQILKERGLEE